ncbi:sensor histidine kinase [Sanguibacter antarcticus]|uniref:histidine kinase n=1 Tax=Sanguibacter antarcticus TaxID=372484 RepID=A0A2A9E1K4_9MICO|nr:HAMP domain-containing sensor histidine kinase [Sanguibacter antarcticus]PFG32451.1 phospho-acceptor domain-containing protein [Sanguibacter antarcticus]
MTTPSVETMARPPSPGFTGTVVRFLGNSPRAYVIALQAPFAVTVFGVSLAVWVSARDLFLRPMYLVGFTMAVVLTLVCVLVPWTRSRSPVLLVIGMLDIVAGGLMRTATNAELGVLGLLVVFPAMWFATQYRWRGVALGTFGTLAVLLAPLLVSEPGVVQSFDLRFWMRTLLFPWIVFMVGVTVAGFTEFAQGQDARLRNEQARLAQSLAASRRASVLLESILNTVDIGLYSLDADGRPLLANRKHRELGLLMAPPDADPLDTTAPWCAEEQGSLMYEMDRITPVLPENRPTCRALHGQMVEDQRMWLGDDPLTQRAVSVTSREIRESNGDTHGTIVAVHDITEMVQAMRTKDDFVATVSHELRTPLTSIIGYLDLIADAVEDEEYEIPDEVQGHLTVVSRNAEQLLVLVSDLLLTAQAEAGTLRFRMSDVKIGQLASRAIDSFRPRAEAAGVTLKQNIDETRPQHADHARISQVIDNLLSNAIKYTLPGGSVRVVVHTDADATLIVISDTGIGMNPHDLGSLFQKFFRAESARAAAIPGVGLGLVITKAIVDGHKGTIDMKSVLGVGSTVTVVLPRF